MAKTKDKLKPNTADKLVDKMDTAADKFMDRANKIADKFEDKMAKVKPGAEDKVIDKFTDKVDKAVDKFTDKMDKFVDKLVDKAEPGMSEDQDVAWHQYGAEAFAVGENTFTEVDATSKIVDHGPVTTAKIDIKATAVAEGDSAYASADTYVVSNFDISLLINFEEESLQFEGVSYDISNAKFIGIDLPDNLNFPGGSKNMQIVIQRDGDPDWNPDLYGNIAVVSLDAEAVGDATLVTAEVGLLTVEDTLSSSTLEVTSAVA
jgi:hypothetical protein